MKEQDIPPNHFDRYVEFLSKLHLFEDLRKSKLKKLVKLMKEVSVEGNETLIQEGLQDYDMYILFYGRLQVTKGDCYNPIAEITPGEVVGEISLLTGLERTATVVAMRDCLLLKLSQENFHLFEEKHSTSSLKIAKTSIKRLMNNKSVTLPGENISIIAIMPAGNSHHRDFVHALHDKLNVFHKSIVVDQQTCNEFFHQKIAQSDLTGENNYLINNWIQTLVDDNRYLILVTDSEMTPWTQRCLREADHVIFIAEFMSNPALNSIEHFYHEHNVLPQKTSDLIFVHPENSNDVSGAKQWLENRIVNGYYHMKMSSEKDIDKIVRVITEQAIGVVLNGGGARGYAHVGVLKAFEELGIPIDFIGGTSMGAHIACMYSYKGLEFLISTIHKFARNYRGDYTFPFLSFFKGRRLYHFMEKWYNDATIEDLWTSFFCISCNLSKGTLNIHDEGSLKKAIRMSTSLPAVFPPMYEGEDMIVDGGILDNMPVNIMRNKMRGGKIIAVNCCADTNNVPTRTYDRPFISGWELLAKSMMNMPLRDKKKFDNIFDIILLALKLGSSAYQEEMCEQADHLVEVHTSKYGLLDFYQDKEIIDTGYSAGLESLSSFK